jgi:hypothetical protein
VPPVAPLGETPPPVGPEAPLEPEPLVPLEPVPLVPDVGADEPDVPELAPEEAEPDEDEPPVDDEVVSVVEVVDVVELVDAGGWDATVAVGTVSAGAPAVSVAGELPPPHPARPAHSASPASAPAIRPITSAPTTTRRRSTSSTSDVERFHPPSAVRAVVQVLLAELIAPIAEAEVLD